jgi:hypothetical protein
MAAIGHTKTRLGRRRVLAAAAALIGLAAAANALADPGPVGLEVVDRDSGRTLPIWRHDGRLFVAGRPGERYSLRITNRTSGRVLVVVSVDGVNIVTGQTASYDQNGYVFDPHQSYDVSGWRKSDTEVAAFSFAPLPQSYAARTGRPENVGVIGMAVFKERPLLEPVIIGGRAPPSSRATPVTAQAPAAQALPAPPRSGVLNEVVVTGARVARRDFGSPSPVDKLGTAHGAREWSAAQRVAFVRATAYPLIYERIEYDTYDHLVADGVIPGGRAEDHRPRAFPAQPHGGGFVPDPPDER